jgi:hypothetical protein
MGKPRGHEATLVRRIKTSGCVHRARGDSFICGIEVGYVVANGLKTKPRPSRATDVARMLQQLTAKQIECLEHAALCRERAKAATDPIDREHLLGMADRWEFLARSYGFSESLSDFIASRKTLPQNYDPHREWDRRQAYVFCLQKARVARLHSSRSETLRDYEHWAYLEAKWTDLANLYRSDQDVSITQCPHCSGSMVLSFIEPADPGYERRVSKCVACEHVEDVRVSLPSCQK